MRGGPTAIHGVVHANVVGGRPRGRDRRLRVLDEWQRLREFAPERTKAPHAGGAFAEETSLGVRCYATSAKSCSSADRASRRVFFMAVWIWQTRLSETPRISPISASVRCLT